MLARKPITNLALLALLEGLELTPAERQTLDEAKVHHAASGKLDGGPRAGGYRATLISIAKAHGHLCSHPPRPESAEFVGRKTIAPNEYVTGSSREGSNLYAQLVKLGQRQLRQKPPLPRCGT